MPSADTADLIRQHGWPALASRRNCAASIPWQVQAAPASSTTDLDRD
jgi:hypothetical protein